MSLYNMLFGQNPMSPILLSMVNLTRESVGRFRDCYAERDADGWLICVYTRNGGGNREHWNDEAEEGPDCSCTGCIGRYRLPSHPRYVRDEDDDFDCTYATFYFRVPEAFAPALEAFGEENATPAQRWERLLDKLRRADISDPEVANAAKVMRPVLDKIAEATRTPDVRDSANEPDPSQNGA